MNQSLNTIVARTLMLLGRKRQAKDYKDVVLHSVRTGTAQGVPFRIAAVKGGKKWLVMFEGRQPVEFNRELIESSMVHVAWSILNQNTTGEKDAGGELQGDQASTPG